MWLSTPTTHTCRGHFRRWHICERCFRQIEPGEEYERYVWRPEPGGRLHVMIEHLHEKDCPYQEQEMFMQEECVIETTATIQLVAKIVAVEAVDVSGNTFTEMQTVLETEIVESYESEDSDKEIPF